LQRELRKVTMLLHPSVEEACPLALLEAMALGLPIVADATAGGVPWVLDNGRAGFLTNMRKVEQVARSMLDCITNSGLRELKRRNAYNRVFHVFSPSKVAEQYENMYRMVLSSHYGRFSGAGHE
jgi:L-malate glycosyltransferase